MSLAPVLSLLSAELDDFDAALLPGTACGELVPLLAAAEKRLAMARVQAAARAADCKVHRSLGFSDAADWLSRASGSSRGEARTELEVIDQLGSLPMTASALASGDLSFAQAAEIARTARTVPGSEQEMVATAQTSPLQTLRERGREKRLDAVDPEELARRQHRNRAVRAWDGDDGMKHWAIALPPIAGTAFANRLDAETDRVWRESDRSEMRQAYAADAFLRIVERADRRRGGTDVVLVCDLAAYRRGHAHECEPCHVVGGSPVPAREVRRVVEEDDPFLKVALHDGTRIESVWHVGRHIPAALRTALDLGAPPRFRGVSCVDGCGRRHALQWDHVDPVANRGPTTYANLRPRCGPCHREKTERDRSAGLLGDRRPP